MPTPQPGIFAQGTRAHYYLEFEANPGASDVDLLEAIGKLRQPPVTAGGANIVIAFGPDLWRRLAPEHAPADLAAFEGLHGVANHVAPATQRDLLLWVHGTNSDVTVDIARAATVTLEPVATLGLDQQAFVYQDSRDFTGFIDGTENPPVWEAHLAALVADGEAGAGGSHVLSMRWTHDLGRFHALPEEEQERIIGRHKGDSEELDENEKPPTAHIARTVIVEDGEELEVWRRSTPWGDVREQGLYFIAFSTEPTRLRTMLSRMFGLAGDGLHDGLLEFTQADSGSFWFAPSLDALHELFS